MRLGSVPLGCLAIVWLGSVCSPAPVHADEQLGSLLQQEIALSTRLQRSTDQLAGAEQELSDLTRDAPVLAYRIKELDRQIDALRTRLAQRKQDARAWARALYKLSRGGAVRLLIEAPDRREMLFRGSMMRQLFERQVGEIAAHGRGVEALGQLRGQLRLARDQRLSQLQSLRLKQQQLSQRLSRRQNELRQLRAKRRRRQRLVQPSETERRQLRQLDEAERARNGRDPLQPRKGRLPWPLKGRLVGRFGQVPDGRTHLPVARSGITIHCGRGAVARAVHAGIVRRSGPLSGYGQLVLLEHDDGFFTVYAFLDEATVTTGQRVSRGAALGRAGVDPLRGHPALYFEVRHQRHTEDPLGWLAR